MKLSILKMENKSGQEEIVGFALIIIIVAVILLIFLGFFLRDSQKEIVESYEVENFIQAFLQYTSDCRDSGNLEYFSIKKLIFSCDDKETCLDGRDSCEVLNSTLTGIIKESWKIKDRPVKGYLLNISMNSAETVLFVEKGNITKNYKGAVQDFSKWGSSVEIFFTVYY